MGTPPLATAPLYNDDPNTPRPWYRRSWFIVTVMVVVSLAIATVTWWGLRGDDNGAAPSPPTPGASTPPASNGEQGYLPDTVDRFGQQIRVPRNPAGFALPQVSVKGTRELIDPAAGVQCQRIYDFGAALFSTSDGPDRIDADGLARGIAHTPQGSVIAASQIIARVFYGPPEVRRKAMTEQVIGPEAAKQSVLDLVLPPRQYPRDQFIRIDPQYSDTFSRVSLASGPRDSAEYASGVYYSVTTLTVVWDQGQWKWRIPDEGFSAATADTRIESVAGWAQWK